MPDKKKATPKAADQTQNHHSNLNKPYKPKSQRERRLLDALIKGAVIRHDLDTIVGTDNAPEYVSRLRLAGWEISTERIPAYDSDGNKTRIGRYHLSRVHRALAQTILTGGGDG